MVKREEREVEEAFISSSTDEIHHTRTEYIYVDKVGLSTNKFYMIDWLDPAPQDAVARINFMRHAFSSNPHALTYRQRAFISYFRHCEDHLHLSRIFRCLYLLKGMDKVLHEEYYQDYIDKIDKHLASELEISAYLTQINDKFTPNDLKRSLFNYLKMKYKRRFERVGGKLINAEEFSSSSPPITEMSILTSSGKNNCSQWLTEVFMPMLTEFVKMDEDKLLSQFTFGIVVCFTQLIYPIIYFVQNLEDLRGKKIGYCFVSKTALFKNARFPLSDIVVVPTQEIESFYEKERSEEKTYNFILNNYVNVDNYFYNFAIDRLWREVMSKKCPCAYTTKATSECPLQDELYTKIRRFLLSDKRKQVEIFNKENSYKDLRIKSIGILYRNAEVTKLYLDFY